jgi:F420-dependent oxidoreductase-like protein
VTIRIGLSIDPAMPRFLELAREAERIGVDSVWVAEYWAYDAFTPLAAISSVTERLRLATGIAQLGARTPAMLAMTAQGVQALSNGRLILGIGVSGPQVMEGWHGVRFGRPVQRTRETIEIIKMVTAGERLSYDGIVYQLPLPDGQGRAIRSRAETAPIPVYVASLGPANLRLTGELADGWIGNSFFPATADAFFDPIRAGAASAGRSLDDVDRVVAVGLELTADDPDIVRAAGRRHADGYAFTFGAMGSATKNFYNDAFARQGYGHDVAEVQRLWASGDREAAAARVPVEIGLATNLVGPPAMIRDRLAEYERSGVTTLRVGVSGDLEEQVADIEILIALAAEAGEQVASPTVTGIGDGHAPPDVHTAGAG